MLAADELGISSSELDVKVIHSKEKDTILFYSTIMIAPCLSSAFGFGAETGCKQKSLAAWS